MHADHNFLANIGHLIKGGTFDAKCISKELFGKKLVDRTIQIVTNTRVETLVADIYDNKIRNAIGHPGKFIDPESGEVSFFSKGQLLFTLSKQQCLSLIDKAAHFHMSLVHAKYKLSFIHDNAFLGTGGILSLQPEIFEKTGEEDAAIATIVVNQLWCFEKYTSQPKWWADNLKISIVTEDEINRLVISVKREESKYIKDGPGFRKSEYEVSEYMKDWVDIALKTGDIKILYRKCYLPIDLLVGAELPWLPYNVYADYLNEEVLYFVKSMELCGSVRLTEELREQLDGWGV